MSHLTTWTTKYSKVLLSAICKEDKYKGFFEGAFWHIVRAHQNAHSLHHALKTHNTHFNYILESSVSVVIWEHSREDPNFKPRTFARVEFKN